VQEYSLISAKILNNPAGFTGNAVAGSLGDGK
jgi:hypothetical protein